MFYVCTQFHPTPQVVCNWCFKIACEFLPEDSVQRVRQRSCKGNVKHPSVPFFVCVLDLDSRAAGSPGKLAMDGDGDVDVFRKYFT